MAAPLAIQLYSVRENLAGDFHGVVERIAEMGYVGVEPTFKLPGTTIKQAADLFRRLGLHVPSAHVPLPLGEEKRPVLEAMAAFGSPRVVSGKGPEYFETLELIRKTCGLLNEAHGVAAENGLRFGYHNHWWEFEQVEGRLAYEVMLEHLHPEIFFEVDTYWAQTAGLDPVVVVKELGARAELLHIKDGPALQGVPQVAVGQGVLDVHGIVQASGGTAEWLIVELDDCATDMMEAVELSCHYLVGEGLAHGSKG